MPLQATIRALLILLSGFLNVLPACHPDDKTARDTAPGFKPWRNP